MARRRMYVFERAYVDYATRVRRFLSRLGALCRGVWEWFWEGAGAVAIELLLRILIVVSAVGMAVAYVRYENAHGRGFSASMLGVFLVIILYAVVLLWGWKALVHFLARLVSGASAAGVVLALALAALAVATGVFSGYFLILFALTALSCLVFVPLRVAQWLWLLYRRISYRCPHGDCSYTGLPIYICKCGTAYHDLHAGFYGLLHHTCRHSDQEEIELPTMDILGRNKLPRLCGGCQRAITHTDWGELAEWPIALVGGPFTGKTVWLVQAIRLLREHFGALRGSVALSSDEQKGRYAGLEGALVRGQPPPKTLGGISEAWGLAVRVPKGQRYPKGLRSLLYMFDNPGEVFGSMRDLGQMHAIGHLKGILLVVDPFSLPALSEEGRRMGQDLKASETPLLTVTGNLINAVNQYLKVRPGEKCRVPLAMVLTKADALPIEQHAYLADLLPGDGRAAGAALSARCRGAIDKLGGGPSLRALELNFSNVRCFACSALGRMPRVGDSRPFAPAGVLDPFLWVLDCAVRPRSTED